MARPELEGVPARTPTIAHESPVTRLRLALFVIVSALAVACGQDPTEDGRTMAFDFLAAAGRQPLRDLRSRLEFGRQDSEDGFLVSGWSTPSDSGDGQAETCTWVTATRASLDVFLASPRVERLHFRCVPYRFENAPRQMLDVVLNGVPVGTVELRPGWRRYRLNLPTDSVTVGKNTVELSFTYSARPSDHGGLDTRELAACFDSLSFGREGEAKPLAPLEMETPRQHRILGDQLVQPVRSELVVPVTVPRGGALEFGVSSDTATNESVIARLLVCGSGGDREELFASSVSGQEKNVRVELTEYAEQRVSVVFQILANDDAEGSVSWRRPRLMGLVGNTDLSRNVILIVIDTLRSDMLSSYGGPVPTPNIDMLAEQGVLFRNVYSHAPMTMPSHSSLFTSLLPSEHGAVINTRILSDDHTTLAELLQGANRRTAAFVSLGVLSAQFGISQGFDEFHDDFQERWWKSADEMNREILPWLDSLGSEPFFLWTHYSDPHEPYAPPDVDLGSVEISLDGMKLGNMRLDSRTKSLPAVLAPGGHELSFSTIEEETPSEIVLQRVRLDSQDITVDPGHGCETTTLSNGKSGYGMKLPATLRLSNLTGLPIETSVRLRARRVLSLEQTRQLYMAEIQHVDREIGRLLATLHSKGLMEDSLIVLTSDHGEGLGDHDWGGHVQQLYDSLIKVPLIIVAPGRLPAGLVIEEPVSHVDVLPTVVDLLSIPDGSFRVGTSLVPLMDRTPGPDDQPIYAETFRPEAAQNLNALVANGYKLIYNSDEDSYELYRQVTDPLEQDDLADDHPELVRKMSALLHSRIDRAKDRGVTSEESVLTEDEKAAMQELGYIR